MSLYLVVKVVWIAAAAFGHAPDGYGTADWAVLNTVTVVMAATGVALGLALAQGWGRRLHAVPVVFFSWVGAGFLVPMLPFMAVKGVLGGVGPAPRWETVFLGIGFAGMAVGLAVALPIYFRERWPRAFVGRVGDGPRFSSPLVTAAVLGAVVLGALWCLWAAGVTVGLDPAQSHLRDLNGRLLYGSSGLAALLGAWSVWTLTRRRPVRLPLWVPVSLAFGTSGSLFAWSGWKLPMVLLRPGGFTTAEYVPVAVVEHVLGIGVGLTFMAVLLRAVAGPSE
ncbi:hypothetical protein ACIBF1_11685 [Spirillospora sp. NPDC050679]